MHRSRISELVIVFQLLGVGLFGACAARAEIVQCGPPQNQHEYHVIGSQLEFRWHHPLRVFRGVLTGLTGTLLANPDRLSEGLLLDVSLPTTSFETPDLVLGEMFRQANAKNGPGRITFLSRASRLPPQSEVMDGRKTVIFIGDLAANGISQTIEVPFSCSAEAEFFRCQIEMNLPPSWYSDLSPTRLGLRARDKVAFRGDVTFGPKKEL